MYIHRLHGSSLTDRCFKHHPRLRILELNGVKVKDEVPRPDLAVSHMSLTKSH